MKTILQLVLGTALLQPQYPQEKPVWVKVEDVSHQQYQQAYPMYQDRVVDFIHRTDSAFIITDSEDVWVWVEWYSLNKDTMMVLPADTADDSFTIWVEQQQQ